MTAKYFVIQCIGFAGTLLFFFSYQCKSNRNLFRIQFLSYFIYTIHLILLGAMTGGISYIINTFRSFCLGGKWKSAKSWGMCAVICFLQIITLVLTRSRDFQPNRKMEIIIESSVTTSSRIPAREPDMAL